MSQESIGTLASHQEHWKREVGQTEGSDKLLERLIHTKACGLHVDDKRKNISRASYSGNPKTERILVSLDTI